MATLRENIFTSINYLYGKLANEDVRRVLFGFNHRPRVAEMNQLLRYINIESANINRLGTVAAERIFKWGGGWPSDRFTLRTELCLLIIWSLKKTVFWKKWGGANAPSSAGPGVGNTQDHLNSKYEKQLWLSRFRFVIIAMLYYDVISHFKRLAGSNKQVDLTDLDC